MKRRYFVLAVAVVLAACGSSGSTAETAVPGPSAGDASVDGPSQSPSSSGGSSGGGGFDAAPPPSPACAGKLIPPRDQTLTLDFGGDTRTFDVHVPDRYDPFAEVARTLGITEVNAKVNFHHAVQKLKQLVQR